jgi:hypothetical protein
MKVLSIAISLSVLLVFQGVAADKAGRVSGSVINLNRDKSEITVRQGTDGTASRTVVYGAATRFTMGDNANSAKAAPTSADQVEVGKYLTCTGAFDGNKLAATNCTMRDSKRP